MFVLLPRDRVGSCLQILNDLLRVRFFVVASLTSTFRNCYFAKTGTKRPRPSRAEVQHHPTKLIRKDPVFQNGQIARENPEPIQEAPAQADQEQVEQEEVVPEEEVQQIPVPAQQPDPINYVNISSASEDTEYCWKSVI